MKILMLTWEYPPRIVGGIARVVHDLSHRLIKDGHEVTVVTYKDANIPNLTDFENDKGVTDVSKAKYVVTNYLSKENETKDRQNLMKAFDKETMTTPEYKDVKIAFKVTEPTTSDRILINYAQISEQTDKKGIHREDRDSTPNVWKGEDDEDIEKVRVLYFDLALRKWVTEAYVTENGQTRVIETGHHAEDDPEEVVKVDLRKSKLDSVVVKFKYHIRITNEGEIEGYAKEIKDRINS